MIRHNLYPCYCVDCDKRVPAAHAKPVKIDGVWCCEHYPHHRGYGAGAARRAAAEAGYSDDGYDAAKDARLVAEGPRPVRTARRR